MTLTQAEFYLRSTLENKPDEATYKDLDETRRLIYGALAAATARTKHWELVGTLTNALVHHSGLETNPYRVIGRLLDVVSTDVADGEAFEQGKDWLRSLAKTITARLDSADHFEVQLNSPETE